MIPQSISAKVKIKKKLIRVYTPPQQQLYDHQVVCNWVVQLITTAWGSLTPLQI